MKKPSAPDLLPRYDFSSGVRGKYVERLKGGAIVRVEQAQDSAQPVAPHGPTKRQIEYLLFIAKYIGRFGRAPAEADIERHFLVSAPAVNQMMQTLERRGFIARQAGVPRSARICIDLAGPHGRGAAPDGRPSLASTTMGKARLPRKPAGAQPKPMSKTLIAEILGLSVPARIGLIALLLESIAAAPEPVLVSAELKAELDDRLKKFEADPEAGYSWGQVTASLRDGTWRTA